MDLKLNDMVLIAFFFEKITGTKQVLKIYLMKIPRNFLLLYNSIGTYADMHSIVSQKTCDKERSASTDLFWLFQINKTILQIGSVIILLFDRINLKRSYHFNLLKEVNDLKTDLKSLFIDLKSFSVYGYKSTALREF